jgi:hypothetical protein
MSSRAGAASMIDRAPGLFEPISPARSNSSSSSSVAYPAVLLVGRSGSWSSVVLKSLEKTCCELSFETPQNVSPRFARKTLYDVILLDSTVPPEQRKALVAELVGSETSIYYTFPVENGCWWLPALRRGQDCLGEPAFRRSEFLLELERVLGSPAQG